MSKEKQKKKVASFFALHCRRLGLFFIVKPPRQFFFFFFDNFFRFFFFFLTIFFDDFGGERAILSLSGQEPSPAGRAAPARRAHLCPRAARLLARPAAVPASGALAAEHRVQPPAVGVWAPEAGAAPPVCGRAHAGGRGCRGSPFCFPLSLSWCLWVILAVFLACWMLGTWSGEGLEGEYRRVQPPAVGVWAPEAGAAPPVCGRAHAGGRGCPGSPFCVPLFLPWCLWVILAVLACWMLGTWSGEGLEGELSSRSTACSRRLGARSGCCTSCLQSRSCWRSWVPRISLLCSSLFAMVSMGEAGILDEVLGTWSREKQSGKWTGSERAWGR
jgi:hypothetical protein